nr:MAG TPA: hypothetical protein [Caudoviricetes sp.]DAX43759.1 MAG TPA: hypothetical protein [Caudoviricetes sp.]
MIFEILTGVCLSSASDPPKIANLGHIQKRRRQRFKKTFSGGF